MQVFEKLILKDYFSGRPVSTLGVAMREKMIVRFLQRVAWENLPVESKNIKHQGKVS
jgi:hypothetical protein